MSMHPPLFLTTEALALFEARMDSTVGALLPASQIEWAWHLRQRDGKRTLELADAAAAQLAWTNAEASPEIALQRARLLLVRSELNWLAARLPLSQAQAEEALSFYEKMGDQIGIGDANWALVSVLQDSGRMAERNQCLNGAIVAYQMSGEVQREQTATARRLFVDAFADVEAASSRLNTLGELVFSDSPVVQAWLESARAIIDYHTGEPAKAIKHHVKARDAAKETGQIRHAILSLSNGADCFASLGDMDTALEWIEAGLALARQALWPGMLGNTLMQTGNIQRLMGRLDDAKSSLEEALSILEQLPTSNMYGITLQYLGDLALDQREPRRALGYFDRALEHAIALGEPLFVMRCWRGQAAAQCQLLEPEAALEKVNQALAMARSETVVDEEIKLLRILASLYSRFDIPSPTSIAGASAPLHYLLAAVAIAERVPGLIAPDNLYEELSAAYAQEGNYEEAYRFGQKAAANRDDKRQEDARNRAIAMGVVHDTERTRAEAEHLRALAQTESQRAMALQQASDTLETLGTIGREITRELDMQSILDALYRHVHHLLDTTSFAVYLLDTPTRQLRMVFGRESGQALPTHEVALDHPQSSLAACARDGVERLLEFDTEETTRNIFSGTLATLSVLFAPLLIGERLLGVLSIQSMQSRAYGARERSICHTLCAYGAIALDNASAYDRARQSQREADTALQELRAMQIQLVQSEKMASLGRLVAGLSHELNTPLGNSLTAMSTLTDRLVEFRASTQGSALSRKRFDDWLVQVTEIAHFALGCLERSIRLVQTFKQISVDRSALRRQSFSLAQVTSPLLGAFQHKYKDSSIGMEVGACRDISLHGFPEVLLEILTQLVDNAVLHGFAQRGHGLITIATEDAAPGKLLLRVRDDGHGIADDHGGRVFDPFFTTRLGQGTSGLGLHIVYIKVTQILGGTITTGGNALGGTDFVITIPTTAPDPQDEALV
jgi:signal transduction histidine kinase